jgi:AmmeMemoRadiSam system protein B/AmmeMemoRadiSam system protein A
MVTIRPAAVAGMFYPGSAQALAHQVATYLEAAQPPLLRPKALIAPHAGYVYSGPIAATAYALLRPLKGTIRRVVLLGPVHRVWVQGLALPGVDVFRTPLGDIPVDQVAVSRIQDLAQVEVSAEAHAQEHSLEVHLPFLQSVLGSFELLPLAVGGASPTQVAEVLDRLWGGPETLIVVSSDLSHYLAYAVARDKDKHTVDAVLNLDATLVGEQACGAHPINGLLVAAKRRGLTAHLLDLRNSGDTAGDKNRVVGYAALAFTEPEPGQAKTAVPDKGAMLTAAARAAIAAQFGSQQTIQMPPEWLKQKAATFVTLTQNGQLRGCIGSLEAHRPLSQDLMENARAAAFRDPRFPALSADELARTRVEVSILSPATPMHFSSEADLLLQLRPGIDGILIEHGVHRATFLPQVWEQLPEPRQFMAHLKQKAGLPADFWADDMRVSHYTVEKYKEAMP